MDIRAVLFLSIVAGLIGGYFYSQQPPSCGYLHCDEPGYDYPLEVRESYLIKCVKSLRPGRDDESKDYENLDTCECILSQFERDHSYERWLVLTSGPPDEIFGIMKGFVLECSPLSNNIDLS